MNGGGTCSARHGNQRRHGGGRKRCPSLGPALGASSSSASVSQAMFSAQTTKVYSINRANTGGTVQMNLSRFLSAGGSRRIAWTAPLLAPQGENVQRVRKDSRGSAAKPINIEAEPGAKGGEKDIGDDFTWPDCLSEEICNRWRSLFPRQVTSSC